jgi:hypothetical protein
MKVYKYQVSANDYFELELPIGAQVLTVDVQYATVCLWAIVDPNAKTETRRFRVAGTGHDIVEPPSKLDYIGTFQLHGGMLVFHVFEVLR